MAKPKSKSDGSRRPTILNVAEVTGFSQGAVSRAINGQGGIGDATRETILKAAREIGYFPNPSARNFKRGYTKRIGIIFPNLANTNYSELYENLDIVTAGEGYSSILALTHFSAERERNLMYEMSAGGADALVVNPVSGFENFDVYRRLKSWRYPLLFLYRGNEGEFDSLGVDYAPSLRIAMEYLRDVGHRKVAFVGHVPPGRTTPTGKRAVLIEVLREMGMEYDEKHSVHGLAADVSGEEAFQKWAEIGSKPTMVVAFNDETAISLMVEAQRLGVSVPGEISFLGSDDISAAGPLGLSTLRVDRRSMAKTIFEMLGKRIKDYDSPAHSKVLRSEFVLRGTTGPARSSAR